MSDSKLKKTVALEIAIMIFFIVISFVLCGIKGGILGMCLGILLFAVNLYRYRLRKKEIEKLNAYLDRILAGGTELEIMDQGEGEYYILKSNIYKATNALITQREKLKSDKIFLADAITDISHQFKTPLTSLFVMNDLLADEEDEDKKKEFLNTQKKQLEKVNWLIQNLLKLSKLDAGLLEFKKDKVPDEELVKEMLSPFGAWMELKNITCDTMMSGITFACDRHWSLEALQNIVKNCIEHLPEGGALSISDNETNLFYEMIIEDNGPGIDKEDLPHIFERFYRGKNAGTDSVGIGLALAKTILEKQNGEIAVTSTPGKGTKFDIKFYKTII